MPVWALIETLASPSRDYSEALSVWKSLEKKCLERAHNFMYFYVLDVGLDES